MTHPLVIPYLATKYGEELRFSLRSIERHLPEVEVVVIGDQPEWLTGVTHITFDQSQGSKYENSTAIMRMAVERFERFVWTNDDIFFLDDVERLLLWNRGPVAEVAARYRERYADVGDLPYVEGMEVTAAMLVGQGFADPLSFEVHAPLPVESSVMARALDLGRLLPPGVAFHKRTAYGNLLGEPSQRCDDFKVTMGHPAFDPLWPVVSTDTDTFRWQPVGSYLQGRFPARSRFERK